VFITVQLILVFEGAAQKEVIKTGLDEMKNATCIIFKERTTETAYVNVKNNDLGCYAVTGYYGIKQDLNLQAPGSSGGSCIYVRFFFV